MVKETKRQMEARHIERLAKAYLRAAERDGAWYEDKGGTFFARHAYANIRAAVYAVVPGKQKAANIGPLLDQAVTAVCRVIRRSGK